MTAEINDLTDVKQFMHDLIAEGLNAHPDELFENYINTDTDEPAYTAEEAESRNHLMRKSFEVCEREGVDIYDFMQEIFLKDTGLDQFIPLPSGS